MQIADALPNHRVYQSIRKVLAKVTADSGAEYKVLTEVRNSSRIYRIKGTYLINVPIKFSKENIYVLTSPLMSMESWRAHIGRTPVILVEEYWTKKNTFDAVAKLIFKACRRYPFFALTKRTYDFLKNAGNTVFLIPPAEKKGTGDRKRKHILFVGRLTKMKNPELIIKIAKIMSKEKFVIVGQGELSEKIIDKIAKMKNVRYIPVVNNRSELFELYKEAKLFIHPAIKDPVGFVIIEALSMSTPCLASTATGSSDYLPKEWTVDIYDELVWVEKVKKIIENLEQNVKIAEKIFENEHLNIDDEYFYKVADDVERYIYKNWPELKK